MRKKLCYGTLLLLSCAGGYRHALAQEKEKIIVQTPGYTIYADSVVQGGRYRAKVLSPLEMTSDYRSPASRFKDARISFKFSINGKDNEMVSGVDHHYTCVAKDGVCMPPVITFGTQLNEPAAPKNVFLAPDSRLVLRVDLKRIFRSFDSVGYFTTMKGERLYKEDFKGLYVAGSTSPMTWDFDNLVNHPDLKLEDKDGDHIYETTLELNKAEDEKKTDHWWKLGRDISAFPSFRSELPLPVALYNLSLEEMCKAIEADSTFRTGKEWAGVWTRDISYSIILSMAYLQPEVAMKSLMKKVNGKGKIIQDTGTGGAYPCSTDRMIWAIAAWEIYLATGDGAWLKKAYNIIRRTMQDDQQLIYDARTGLVRGESSFLDWREQTYPAWMQPADIFQSECLGTNAVHYQANKVLSRMAHLLHDERTAGVHAAIAASIRAGINHYLWMPEKGYYAQYLYGRNYPIVSPRWEALGEALCILWDIADSQRQRAIIRHAPMTAFGIPCIYPQIPNIPPYHNDAVWPFVETFWTWAAVKAGNGDAVLKGIGDIYRPAALFLTNKENFEAGNGDFSGTQINSSNMLWSLSGNISLVHKVLFGIHFTDSGILFLPCVPRAMAGKMALNNFKYRKTVVDIEVEGWGDRVQSFQVDGRETAEHRIGAGWKGKHRIFIRLSGKTSRHTGTIGEGIRVYPDYYTVSTPEIQVADGELSWLPVPGAVRYQVLRNGVTAGVTGPVGSCHWKIRDTLSAEYQVIALDSAGVPSFASEPVMANVESSTIRCQAEDFAPSASLGYKGFTGAGFIALDGEHNRTVTLPVEVGVPGEYMIDFRYANGNGPVNTENKCAIRTLLVDGTPAGTILFPQRGKNEWSNWGYSNPARRRLTAGRHRITLVFGEHDDNMNGDTNQAMLDCMRLIRVSH